MQFFVIYLQAPGQIPDLCTAKSGPVRRIETGLAQVRSGVILMLSMYVGSGQRDAAAH